MARSLEDKVDEILNQLKLLAPLPEKLDSLCGTVKSIQEDLNSAKVDIGLHEDRVTKLEDEVGKLKAVNNDLNQQSRSLTLRILNLPQVQAEKEDMRGRIYDILKPLLVAAKAAKDLPSVPQPATVFEHVFRPYQGEHGKAPPPVIIRVQNRSIKLALLKHRKHLAQPESAPGRLRILLVEDLTPENHRALSLLSKSKKVDKVWSIDGHIKFVLAGQSTVKTVSSVFGSVESMIGEKPK